MPNTARAKKKKKKQQQRHQRKAEREDEGRRARGERIATVITNKNHLSHLCHHGSPNEAQILAIVGRERLGLHFMQTGSRLEPAPVFLPLFPLQSKPNQALTETQAVALVLPQNQTTRFPAPRETRSSIAARYTVCEEIVFIGVGGAGKDPGGLVVE
ncbi:unnamed protein product [Pleuronectes platessa]|uniref:Uncharacterized protein n=1 Tax=Pleuronectes platessa TaxID=8262 RepID=A0A9N7Z089_PLEPL|nr:unnamed protein product [Pleuronectes platessa]